MQNTICEKILWSDLSNVQKMESILQNTRLGAECLVLVHVNNADFETPMSLIHALRKQLSNST